MILDNLILVLFIFLIYVAFSEAFTLTRASRLVSPLLAPLQLGEGRAARELELFFENASDSGKDKINELTVPARAELTQRCLAIEDEIYICVDKLGEYIYNPIPHTYIRPYTPLSYTHIYTPLAYTHIHTYMSLSHTLTYPYIPPYPK